MNVSRRNFVKLCASAGALSFIARLPTLAAAQGPTMYKDASNGFSVEDELFVDYTKLHFGNAEIVSLSNQVEIIDIVSADLPYKALVFKDSMNGVNTGDVFDVDDVIELRYKDALRGLSSSQTADFILKVKHAHGEIGKCWITYADGSFPHFALEFLRFWERKRKYQVATIFADSWLYDTRTNIRLPDSILTTEVTPSNRVELEIEYSASKPIEGAEHICFYIKDLDVPDWMSYVNFRAGGAYEDAYSEGMKVSGDSEIHVFSDSRLVINDFGFLSSVMGPTPPIPSSKWHLTDPDIETMTNAYIVTPTNSAISWRGSGASSQLFMSRPFDVGGISLQKSDQQLTV